MSEENHGYQPKLIVFTCNWCIYAAADLAGLNTLVRIRTQNVKCSGKIDPLFLLRCFENGIDGVLVAGCTSKDCPYGSNFEYDKKKHRAFSEYLFNMGIEQGRFQAFWPKEMEGPHFNETFSKLCRDIVKLGPYKKHTQ